MVTDEVLVQAVAKGDPAAFEKLVRRYHGPLFGYLDRLLKDREKAKDFVQETFMKLLHQLRFREAPDHIPSWLYQVARNLCRDYWKSAGYRREKTVFEQMPEPKDRQTFVVDLCERRATRLDLLALLKELPDHQRDIVILRFFHDLKLQEIADLLGCPVGTVKSRLFHALRHLRSHMAEERSVYLEESSCVGCG